MCEKCKLMHNKKYLYVCIVKAMQSILNKVDSFFCRCVWMSFDRFVVAMIINRYTFCLTLALNFNGAFDFWWLFDVRSKHTPIKLIETELELHEPNTLREKRYVLCANGDWCVNITSLFSFFHSLSVCVCVSLISCAISILCPKIFARLILFHNVLMSLEMN